MEQPQFLQYEYVNETIFNTAFGQLLTSIREPYGGEVYFQPGVANPSSLTYTYNNSLTVTVNAPSPFKCLFNTGQYCSGHGLTNGTNSSTYTVDFTSLVPVSGSVTAYVVAQASTVQEDPVLIVGPPPGHPDFNANFVPYLGYTSVQDTLNIFATTNIPDNLTSIELGRILLNAGQISITANSIDTSYQVLTSVIVNSITMSGDITGSSNSNVLSYIHGIPVILTGLAPNNLLGYNGSSWIPFNSPTSLPPSGPAGGDLSSVYPNPIVDKSSAPIFDAINISVTNNLTTGGSITGGSTIAAAGTISGANATAIGQAVMLGQFTANIGTNGWVRIPVNNGGTVTSFIVQWGWYSLIGQSPAAIKNVNWTFNFPISFTTACYQLFPTWTDNYNSSLPEGPFQGGMMVVEWTQNLTTTSIGSVFTDYDDLALIHVAATNSSPGLTGFNWWAVGI